MHITCWHLTYISVFLYEICMHSSPRSLPLSLSLTIIVTCFLGSTWRSMSGQSPSPGGHEGGNKISVLVWGHCCFPTECPLLWNCVFEWRGKSSCASWARKPDCALFGVVSGMGVCSKNITNIIISTSSLQVQKHGVIVHNLLYVLTLISLFSKFLNQQRT